MSNRSGRSRITRCAMADQPSNDIAKMNVTGDAPDFSSLRSAVHSVAQELTWLKRNPQCRHNQSGEGKMPVAAAPVSTSMTQATSSTRWIQLVLGLIAMMSISSPQYVWTLFTKPLQEALGAPLSAIQVTFTVVIVLQTFLSPLQGYLVDRFSARILIALGCLLSGLGWITAAYATT